MSILVLEIFEKELAPADFSSESACAVDNQSDLFVASDDIKVHDLREDRISVVLGHL
jgi:hypothetical protein